VGTEPLASPALAEMREARARQRARLRWARPVAIAGIAAANIAFTVNGHPGPGIHGTSLLVSIALAGLVIGVAVAPYALDRLPWLVLAASALQFGSGAALFWLQPHGSAGLAGIGQALVFSVAQLRRRPVAVVALIGTALLVLVAEASRYTAPVASLARYGPFVAVCLLVVVFQRLRDAREHAETLLVQLEESQGAQARAAALAERQRLAREMHDVLAHSLSGLMLQLEGARMLATSSPADPRLPEVVGRAHELAKDGLDEARRAIGMLRGEELPGPAALSTLTSQFEKHSGIPCSFGISGEPWTVRADARLALYRVTQEALTNVIKHADAERVEVCLAYASDRVTLTIEDFGRFPGGNRAGQELAGDGHTPATVGDGNGHGLTGNGRTPASGGNGHGLTGIGWTPASGGNGHGLTGNGRTPASGGNGLRQTGNGRTPATADDGNGHGLTGMRERAELLGGTLAAGATPHGFRVELQVPA
jgi:signal transduction histidine kinase